MDALLVLDIVESGGDNMEVSHFEAHENDDRVGDEESRQVEVDVGVTTSELEGG